MLRGRPCIFGRQVLNRHQFHSAGTVSGAPQLCLSHKATGLQTATAAGQLEGQRVIGLLRDSPEVQLVVGKILPPTRQLHTRGEQPPRAPTPQGLGLILHCTVWVGASSIPPGCGVMLIKSPAHIYMGKFGSGVMGQGCGTSPVVGSSWARWSYPMLSKQPAAQMEMPGFSHWPCRASSHQEHKRRVVQNKKTLFG